MGLGGLERTSVTCLGKTASVTGTMVRLLSVAYVA